MNSSRTTESNNQRIKRVIMAFTLTLVLCATMLISVQKSYAKPAANIIKRVDITVTLPTCGTEVKVEGEPSEWGSDDEVTQTPGPSVKLETTGVILAKDTPAGKEDKSSEFEFANKEDVSAFYFKKEDLFEGKITPDSDIWVKIPILPDYANDYDFDRDPENYYGVVLTKLYVNGVEGKIIQPSGWSYAIAKLDLSKLKHDWDAGKVSGDTKTYTCKGCGATKTEKVPSTASAPLFATMSSKGAKAMNFSWNKVAGAAGYEVYLSKCNTGGNKYTPKKVKTVKGNKTAKCTVKGLKKGVPYKGYVRAYKMVNGKKTYIGKSLTVHAFTNGGNKKYTNAKSVSVKKTSVSLAAGKTFKIKASVKKLKAGKKLLNTKHAPKLRYVSSDKNVATVNGSGTITAKAAGKCKVYAIAANGAKKAIAVTVK